MKWLTDNSRKFLERGYLLPGVSPEERIREIAERAQNEVYPLVVLDLTLATTWAKFYSPRPKWE